MLDAIASALHVSSFSTNAIAPTIPRVLMDFKIWPSREISIRPCSTINMKRCLLPALKSASSNCFVTFSAPSPPHANKKPLTISHSYCANSTKFPPIVSHDILNHFAQIRLITAELPSNLKPAYVSEKRLENTIFCGLKPPYLPHKPCRTSTRLHIITLCRTYSKTQKNRIAPRPIQPKTLRY